MHKKRKKNIIIQKIKRIPTNKSTYFLFVGILFNFYIIKIYTVLLNILFLHKYFKWLLLIDIFCWFYCE